MCPSCVCRSPEEHVFGRRVRSLEAAGRPPGPPLLTHTWFTRAGPKPGRPTAADILSLSSTLDSAPSDMDWYLCGPDSFMNGMRDLLTASGVREEHIKREVF